MVARRASTVLDGHVYGLVSLVKQHVKSGTFIKNNDFLKCKINISDVTHTIKNK